MYQAFKFGFIAVVSLVGCFTVNILNNLPHSIVVSGYFADASKGVEVGKAYLKYNLYATAGVDALESEDLVSWEKNVEVDPETGQFEIDFSSGIVPNNRTVEFIGQIHSIQKAYLIFAKDSGYTPTFTYQLSDEDVAYLNQEFFPEGKLQEGDEQYPRLYIDIEEAIDE
ncbi:MAG: hypothetical protein HOE90_17645 [Bacteriovoracaceae bacterium]|jgi:hypothetical protein|nr:hypothetical protein [Bacteriovoracaceae bacterium]